MDLPFNEDDEADRFFHDLLDAVDQQRVSPQTPFVAKTVDRLIREGLEEDEAREAVARCLAEETDRVLRSGRPFDLEAYRRSLDKISPGS
ncbi:hypothetical protein HNR46_000735 [Haloferula luteola]|uniref:Uncharacterized protein n=1 Tax=Haloferula luteola TaxID=595692 RepID=A0A840UWH4_9BACT|nr:hypothetical protein [Haloferula luteola]MBB5350507.1 hypothetical protein [Haloferula luteola]